MLTLPIMKKLLYILLFAPLTLFGQIINITTENGLLYNSVNCIAIDLDDKVWVGTSSGVSAFTVASFETPFLSEVEFYTTDNGLIDNGVTAIFTSSDNSVWVGTDFGLSVYDGSTWVSYTEDDGLGDNRINHINEDANGSIWVGEKDGLSVFDGEAWTVFTTSDGLPFGGINHVTFDSNGDKWLASSIFGLIHFDGLTFTTYNTNSGLINNNVRSIAIDPENNKWVATGQGISVFNADNELEAHHTMMLILPPPDTLNPVVDVEIDSNGNVWAGIYVDYLVTVGGVAVSNGSTWTGYDDDSGLVGPVVRSLAIDSQSNVWVATSTGVSKIYDVAVALPDWSVDDRIEIYPNPSSSNLIVRTELQIHDFRLINTTGCEVTCPSSASVNGLQLDVTNLDKGFYILDLKTECQNVRKPLLIE